MSGDIAQTKCHVNLAPYNRGGNGSGAERTRISAFFAIQFFSKKRIRIGSGSEFVSAPGNNLETKSALHFAEILGIHLKFGRKNAPILSEVLFFVSLFLLWSSPEIGKNAQSKHCCAD